MQANVGMLDRVLRVLVGTALIAYAFTTTPVPWWGYLGLVPLVTGIVGYCPLYHAADRVRTWLHRRHEPPRVA